jgi:hypothetical protein
MRDNSNDGIVTRTHMDQSTSPIPFSPTAPYAPDTPIAYTSSACNIESINLAPFGTEQVTVAKASPLVVTGWGFDEVQKRPSQALYVVLLDSSGEARYFGSGTRITPRVDVSQHLHLPGLIDVGFEASLSLASVEAGRYHVMVGLAGVSDFRLCDVGRWISVQ